MQIDVDYYTTQAHELPGKLCTFYSFLFAMLDYLPLRKNESYAVLRMYGVTEGGNSVMAHIHNFLSYFYVEVSEKYQSHEFTEEELTQIKVFLNNNVTKT
jgi:hypothetical protein